MAFDLDTPTISLLMVGAAFAALQVWWIGALLVRNHRHRGERPLSSQQFRRDLERSDCPFKLVIKPDAESGDDDVIIMKPASER